jgi:Chalcone isomerase-like
MRACFVCLLILWFALGHPPHAGARDGSLPPALAQQLPFPLIQQGTGKYTKLGFTIYRATLWTASGRWNPAAPYALQLRYARDLSRSTLVEAVIDGIHEQQVADAPTLAAWSEILERSLPPVREGDELLGLAVPGKPSLLFHNGKPIATLEDRALSDAFFGIWFGQQADQTLQAALLGAP